MAQNLYDDPEFFAGYSQLRRSAQGLAGAPEWPAVRALLPDLTGKQVVDLGCGFGWFCRWARENGAAKIVGYDLSEKMLERARHDTEDEGIEYVKADLELLELSDQTFDFAYSSLALHYVAGFARLVKMVHQCLVPGARFVFTIEHPMYTAPVRPKWVRDADGRKSWPINQYAIEGTRVTNWFTEGVVKQHRMLGTTLNSLIDAGFTVRHVQEWSPTTDQLVEDPSLAAEMARPGFVIIAAER